VDHKQTNKQTKHVPVVLLEKRNFSILHIYYICQQKIWIAKWKQRRIVYTI